MRTNFDLHLNLVLMLFIWDVITHSRLLVHQNSELCKTHIAHEERHLTRPMKRELSSAALHEGDDGSPDFCTGSCPVPDPRAEAIREQQLKRAMLLVMICSLLLTVYMCV